MPWGRMDCYNTTTISELATALGVVRVRQIVNANEYATIPNSGVGGLVVVNTSSSAKIVIDSATRYYSITKRATSESSISIERPNDGSDIRVYTSLYSELDIIYIKLRI